QGGEAGAARRRQADRALPLPRSLRHESLDAREPCRFSRPRRDGAGTVLMHVLVVHCHPCTESYAAALRDAVIEGLGAAGHEHRLIDLYAAGFDPVMSAEERRLYHEPEINRRPVEDHLDALFWAEALVFIYPTWWYGLPAMLKGW